MLASGTIALMTVTTPRGFRASNLAAAGVQVTDDVTHVVFRRHNLDLHDRLEQFRAGLLDAFAETGAAGDFEGQHEESTSW
jgi:hypothetical protein